MSLSPEADLSAAIRSVIVRIRGARALRGGSVGLAVGAVVAAATGGWPWLGLGGIGLALGWRWPVDQRAAVARLDAAAELDGALRCAWDHRADPQPMSRAQHAQALAVLAARRAADTAVPVDIRAAPAPAAGWLLGPALCVLPLVMAPGHEPAVGVSVDGADAGSNAAALGAPTPAEADPTVEPPVAPSEAPAERDPRATATDGVDASVDAGPAADAGSGGVAGDGGVGGASPQGVAGRAVGEQGGGPAGAAPVPARSGAGAGLVLPTAAGDRAPGTGPVGRLVVGRTPPPPDAIADPARPYPSRYRRAIAAWFDRSRP